MTKQAPSTLSSEDVNKIALVVAELLKQNCQPASVGVARVKKQRQKTEYNKYVARCRLNGMSLADATKSWKGAVENPKNVQFIYAPTSEIGGEAPFVPPMN